MDVPSSDDEADEFPLDEGLVSAVSQVATHSPSPPVEMLPYTQMLPVGAGTVAATTVYHLRVVDSPHCCIHCCVFVRAPSPHLTLTQQAQVPLSIRCTCGAQMLIIVGTPAMAPAAMAQCAMITHSDRDPSV